MNGSNTTSTQSLAEARSFSSFSQRKSFVAMKVPTTVVRRSATTDSQFAQSVSPRCMIPPMPVMR